MGMATMNDKRKTLTPVQKRFVEEYLRDPSDGAAAYMRASKSNNKKSCGVQASKLLKLPKITEALENAAQETLGTRKVAILKNVDFWLEIRDDKEARTADRMKASENLGKYMQMFVEKKEISGDVQVKIVDDI